MIDLHYWPTPNGWKITIFLEEAAVPYRVVPVNIARGEQFEPAFLTISPNNRMPAIVDSDGPDGKPISIFESGAILLYLAEKTGRFLPRDVRGRFEAVQWLMFQMAGIGPMFGQAGHFLRYAPEKIDSALHRKFDGAGLGLPLSRGLARLHGGDLRLESAPGKGTRAIITLPASRLLDGKHLAAVR